MAARYKEIEVRFRRNPKESFAVGTLAEKDHKLFFEYNSKWLKRNLELSPFTLPLQAGLIKYQDHSFGPLFGLFDDSLPDGWGLLLMDRAFRSKKMDPAAVSVLDRLAYLGETTMGALTYHPPSTETVAGSASINLHELAREAREVYAGKPSDLLPELMRVGGSPGGARPKILVGLNGDTTEMVSGEVDLPEGFEHWLVKFYAETDAVDEGKIEYAYSAMARAAGIHMEETLLFTGNEGESFFGTKRFDRGPENRRYHIHSFAGLIQANFRIPSCDYSDLFKVTSLLTRDYDDLEQLYRLMLFNVLAHNRDDHAKNFSFLFDDTKGKWSLAPAYDLTYSSGPGGEHSTTVNGEGAHPSREQCFYLADQYGIGSRRAKDILGEVADAVHHWPEFADRSGVSRKSTQHLQSILYQLLP